MTLLRVPFPFSIARDMFTTTGCASEVAAPHFWSEGFTTRVRRTFIEVASLEEDPVGHRRTTSSPAALIDKLETCQESTDTAEADDRPDACCHLLSCLCQAEDEDVVDGISNSEMVALLMELRQPEADKNATSFFPEGARRDVCASECEVCEDRSNAFLNRMALASLGELDTSLKRRRTWASETPRTWTPTCEVEADGETTRSRSASDLDEATPTSEKTWSSGVTRACGIDSVLSGTDDVGCIVDRVPHALDVGLPLYHIPSRSLSNGADFHDWSDDDNLPVRLHFEDDVLRKQSEETCEPAVQTVGSCCMVTTLASSTGFDVPQVATPPTQLPRTDGGRNARKRRAAAKRRGDVVSTEGCSNARLWCHFYLDEAMVAQQSKELGFDLAKRLIGRGGENTKPIFMATGAKIRVRGRGSNQREGQFRREAPVHLMVAVSTERGKNQEFREAFSMTTQLLESVSTQFESMCGDLRQPHEAPRFWLGDGSSDAARLLGLVFHRCPPGPIQ